MGNGVEMEDIRPCAPPPLIPLDRALLSVLVESYEGPIDREGRFSGKGKAILRRGSIYEGDFARGSLHGEGTYTWEDGLVYQGTFVENCITGIGNYTWPGGAHYSGGVLNGLRHGYGVLEFEDSVVRYEGEWKNGRRHGQGTLWYDDNGTCCYKGSWRDDKRHGLGELRYASGNIYEGEFNRDIKDGQGKMIWLTGSTYSGTWVKGMPHGHGEQVWEPQATSPWPTKEGLSHLQLQNKYIGEFKEGKRNGKGTFWYATGAQYIGEWHDNLKHGKGVFTYEDGTEYSGYFEDDRPIARGSPMKLPSRHVTLDLSSFLFPTSPKSPDGSTEFVDAETSEYSIDGSDGMTDEVSHGVLNLLLRYNSELRFIYKHYSCGLPGDRSLQTLALPQLWLLLHTSRVVTSCLTFADIDLLIRVIVTAKRDPDDEDPHAMTNHLLYREFLELLVHIAHHRFSDLQSLEERVNLLLKNHIIKHMPSSIATNSISQLDPHGEITRRKKYKKVVRDCLAALSSDSVEEDKMMIAHYFKACQAPSVSSQSLSTFSPLASEGDSGGKKTSTCTLHDLVLQLVTLKLIGNDARNIANTPSTREATKILIDALFPGPDDDDDVDIDIDDKSTAEIFSLNAQITFAEFSAGMNIIAQLRGEKDAIEMLSTLHN